MSWNLSFNCNLCNKDIPFIKVDSITESDTSCNIEIEGEKIKGESTLFILDDEYFLCENCFKEKTKKSLLNFINIIENSKVTSYNEKISENVHVTKIEGVYYFYYLLNSFITPELVAYFILTKAISNKEFTSENQSLFLMKETNRKSSLKNDLLELSFNELSSLQKILNFTYNN